MNAFSWNINALVQPAVAAALLFLSGLAGPRVLAEGGETPVPRITLYAGDTITNEMLVDRKLAPGVVKTGAVFEFRDAVVGKVARRTLFVGQPIPVNALRDPYAVTQGAPVLIVFESPGLTITARGTALQSGGLGDAVQVRNVASGAIISGMARADGSVRVGTQ